jgi:hypothetical protein
MADHVVFGMSKARRCLDEIVALNPAGGLGFDYGTPRQKGSLSTHIQHSDDEGRWAATDKGVVWRGQPSLHVRHRKVPGSDKVMTQFVIYAKNEGRQQSCCAS